MATRSNRNAAESTMALPVDGGINIGVSPSEIADNEMVAATNFYYKAASGVLTTRPALECITTTALANPITAIHAFVNTSVAQVLAVSNGTLYRWNGTTGWTSISALSGAYASNPCFLNFNQKCLIATGHTDIYSWNGSALTTISGSPGASALYEVANRVIANDVTMPDVAYMSAPEDETDWDTVTSAAKAIPMGYGDGFAVNAFSSIAETLVVSKVRVDGGNTVGRRMFGINLADLPENWSARYLSHKNASIGHASIQSFGGDVFFVDSNGFKMLRPTQDYGDITTDVLVGNKINSGLVPNLLATTKLRFLNHFGSFLLHSGNVTYCLHPAKGWTDFYFPTQINDSCEIGHNTYFAGASGHLYKFTEATGNDETAPDVYSPMYSMMRHGEKSIPRAKMFLKRMKAQLDYLANGNLVFEAVFDGTPTTLYEKTITIGGGSDPLVYATDDLVTATTDLVSTAMVQDETRSRYRSEYFQPQIRAYNGARIGIHWIRCHVAPVEG